MNEKICIVYTHHKLGDLIWQLPYIKAISEHHSQSVDLILREKTQAKNILKDEAKEGINAFLNKRDPKWRD